jgi:predicted enzyme related to lactoylglutathione lyase
MTDQDKLQPTQSLSLTSIRIGSSQPAVLAEFYEKFFGRPADIQNGPFHMWQGSGCSFRVSDHSEVTGPTKEPGRILLNFDTKDVKGEFERFKALGLTIVKEPYVTGGRSDYWVATLADPDGNLVQLTTPLEMLAPRPGN